MDDDKIILDRRSFEALAVDSRVKIMKCLTQRRKTLSELSSELNLSVSAVKEHLENLEGAGLIVKMDDGHKWKYYELTRKGKEIIGPKELRVWILLSISLVALIVSVMFLNSPMLGAPNQTAPAMQIQTQTFTPLTGSGAISTTSPQNEQIMKIVTAPDLATPPRPPETEAAEAVLNQSANSNGTGINETTSKNDSIYSGNWCGTIGSPQMDLTFLIVAGISALTMVGCVVILIMNRVRRTSTK